MTAPRPIARSPDPTRAATSASVEPRAFLNRVVAFRHGADFGLGEALDISAQGVFIATDQLLPRGSIVDLKLQVPGDGEPVVLLVRGQVERCKGDPSKPDSQLGMGIRFIDISAAEQQAIRRYVGARTVLTTHVDARTSIAAAASEAGAGHRYDLISLIGIGGSSEVYKAIDRELEEVVALKILKPELSKDKEWVSRLRRETRLARRIQSRHVARTFDFGSFDGRAFITMELIVGTALSQLLADVGELPESYALPLALQILDGLGAAHRLGILHRDLKPSNVVVTSENRVVILDFGLAITDAETRITHVGETFGTPSYMPPEQFTGEQGLTPAADVYSFGCILYQMLTGRVPFVADNFLRLCQAHARETPIPPREIRPTISPSIESIVLRCLAKDPMERYPNAAAVSEALNEALPARAVREPVPPRRRLIVADPDPVHGAHVRELLAGSGYDVVWVRDGLHLVETALANGADLVITSVVLPSIDGFEVCQILRSSPKLKNTPVVLTSERVSDRELLGFIQHTRFVSKPCEKQALDQCLRELGCTLAVS